MTDGFVFEVPAYDQRTVINLLTSYVEIRMALIDRMPKPSRPLYSHKKPPSKSDGTLATPIMNKPRVMNPADGKKRARMIEDLHCAAIDLELALDTLTDEEFSLLSDYYIIGGITLDQLAASRGLSSKGRLQERLMRIIRKLVKAMNHEYL